MIKRFTIPLIFPLTMWIIHLFSEIFKFYPYKLGILPRNVEGLVGILSSPLIHFDISHLISNSFPLIVTGFGIFYFYPKSAYKVFIFVYLCTGLFVWLFARKVYHIGASGIVYAFVSFLFFNGLFRRDTKSISLSLIVVFLYGGLAWGIFPVMDGVSWESHFFGAVSGALASFIFRKSDPSKKYDWENEEKEIPIRELEISYDPERNKFLDE